jgi:hypothetical protein
VEHIATIDDFKAAGEVSFIPGAGFGGDFEVLGPGGQCF